MVPRTPLLVAAGIAASVAIAGVGWIGWQYRSPPHGPDSLRIVEDPLIGARPDAPVGAPNVVVVIGCTLRKDQLSVYAPGLGTTPFLEELASSGAVFDDLITAAPWTRVASTAIVTGIHAVHLGMVEPGPSMSRRSLADSAVTMAEQFRDHGWRTLGATANPNLGSAWNLNQGFDRYIEPDGIWAEGPSGKVPSEPLREGLLDEISKFGGDRPLYLQLMFIEAHSPWHKRPASELEAHPELPEAVVKYRGAVREFDDAVRALHEALADVGLTEQNTVFVVLNDHGEGLGWPTHHGLAHGRYLYPSTVGGLWVMRGPGIPVGRVTGVASQVDVFPTLAELAGIGPVSGADGVSQVTALRSWQSRRDRAFTDTWFAKVERSAVYTNRMACQRSWAASDSEVWPDGCFDRKTDPEHRDPRPDPALEAELDAWKRESMRRMDAFRDGADAEPDAATLERLERLGYVE